MIEAAASDPVFGSACFELSFGSFTSSRKCKVCEILAGTDDALELGELYASGLLTCAVAVLLRY